MTKREYIEKLREFLSYELPERLVKKNTDYYSGYFDEQMKLGKSADEICDELGDPQLIARSCIEVEKAGDDGIPMSGDEPDFSEEMYGSEAGNADSDSREEKSGKIRRSFMINGTEIGCGGCLLALLIIVGILSVISSIFTALFTGGGSGVITVILLIVLVFLIAEYFRRR